LFNISTSQQFERGCESRDEKTEHGIDPTNVSELVRVGEVKAVPRQEEVAFMVGSQRKMECITAWIGWHQFMPNIGFHDLGDRKLDRQERQIGDQASRASACS
jgi:hypothetical protein